MIPQEACPPCSQIQVVNTPGPAGADGASAYTVTTASFLIPAQGFTVVVAVTSTASLVVGLNVFVGAANFLVTGVNSSTSCTLMYVGLSVNAMSAGDTAAGGTVPSGSVLSVGVGHLGIPIAVANGGTGVASYSALATALAASITNLLGGAPLPLINGGTGTTSIALLATALNASLGNILGGVPLSVANGGTGAATVTNALAALGLGQVLTGAYASGAAYTLTITSALMAFGTTSPTITIPTTGSYLLKGRGRFDFNGATYAGGQTLAMKIRRTAAAAGDVANATAGAIFGAVTTVTQTAFWLDTPYVQFSANAGDVIQLWASVSALPSAGTVQSAEASLIAIPWHLP